MATINRQQQQQRISNSSGLTRTKMQDQGCSIVAAIAPQRAMTQGNGMSIVTVQ